MSFALPLFLVALTCSIAFGASGQISESPTEAVRSTLTEVFRILEDEKLKDPANLMPRRHMLEEVIAAQFDYTEMSKRALAAHWVLLTTGERDEFVELFKNFLSDRYAEKIEGYSGEQYSISPNGSRGTMRRCGPSCGRAKWRSLWTTASSQKKVGGILTTSS